VTGEGATLADAPAPPTPPGVPVLKHALAFSRERFDAIERWAEYGSVVRIAFPGFNAYMVTDPELVAEVVHDSEGRFELGREQRERFSEIEEDAIQGNTGDRWRRLRKAIQPAFAREKIDEYADGVVDGTHDWLRARTEGEPSDLPRGMQELTLSLVARTLLGVDVEGKEDIVIDAVDAFIDLTDPGRPGTMLPDWVPTPTDRRFDRAVRDLDAFVERTIDERQRELSEKRSDETTSQGDASDALVVMLAARKRGDLTRGEIHDNLVSLLLAGTDTTAMAFTYGLMLLDQHPEVAAALREEYERHTADGRLDADSWRDLNCARNVVAETLRLYPPAWAFTRNTTEPVVLGGYRLPADADVLLPQWVVHRDERFWDDPTSFDPDRWRGEDDRPEYAYFPFGGGPRHCIGMHLARMELTVGLSALVGNADADVAVDGELQLRPVLSLRPATDLTATIHRR